MSKELGITTTINDRSTEQKPIDPKLLKEIEALTPAFINALKDNNGSRSKKGRGGSKSL